ncbi:hypothetical protein [Polycladidibacter stylochi]|uniref:hypothetical protein n=1 Tax=Polycladidibacter stylochi TaxID=1807766 RepID=UPI000835D54B|nr:hypothetical protein [Pseudovibrio stylochi]
MGWFTLLLASKAGRLLLLALLIGAVLTMVYWQINRHARTKLQAEMAHEALTIEQERKRDATYLQDLSNYHLCIEYFAARGLSDTPCQPLRGVQRQ